MPSPARLNPGGVMGHVGVLSRGKTMGRYHVLRMVGEGGMGAVYEAFDPELGRKVAIKVLHPALATEVSPAASRRNRARLLNEARQLAKLAHPHLIPIFDVGLIDDHAIFVTMEYVAGKTLRALLRQRKHTWRKNLEMVLQAGEGLACAHAANVLHRDFKPDNIMVSDEGWVYVLDFGLCKLILDPNLHHESESLADRVVASESWQNGLNLGNSAESSQSKIVGTPAYMSPEQMRCETIDAKSDVFAFSLVAFEAITGKQAFVATSATQRLQKIEQGDLKWPKQRCAPPKWLREIIEEGLCFDPRERSASVDAMIQRIRGGWTRRSRRNSALVVAALVASATSAIVAGPTAALEPTDPACKDPNLALEQLIDARAFDSARTGFLESGFPAAKQVWRDSESHLQNWQQAWKASAQQLCPSTRLHLEIEPLEGGMSEQGMACLVESASEVSTLLELWQHATSAQVLAATNALASLSAPTACADPKVLRRRVSLPVDPLERTTVRENFSILQAARMRTLLADYVGARAELSRLKPLAPSPAASIVASRKIHVQSSIRFYETERNIESTPALMQSVLTSTITNEAEATAEGLRDLWYARVYRGNQRSESSEILRDFQAAVIRAESPPELQAALLRSRGRAANMIGENQQALTFYQQALQHAQQAFGDHSLEVARAYGDIGITAALMGQPIRARDYDRESLARHQRLLPRSHPTLYQILLRIVEHQTNAGELYQASVDVQNGWHHCMAAGHSSETCLELRAASADALLALGDYRGALQQTLAVHEGERSSGRRADPIDPYAEHTLSLILWQRGELQSAGELANRALAHMQAQVHSHPRAQFQALLYSAQIALALNDDVHAARLIEEAHSTLGDCGEFNGLDRPRLEVAQGQLELMRGSAKAALRRFEKALIAAEEVHLSLLFRASIHRDMARAWLALDDVAQAQDHADLALRSLDEVEGIQEQRRWPIHVVLAQIALAAHRYEDALIETEIAYRLHDSTQILDNRLAIVDFIAAQSLWQLDASPTNRAHALRLAQSAHTRYLDWDADVHRELAQVAAWIDTHKPKT